MAQHSRTFRIFVSSTFSDLKAERNALQEKVFPRLRDLAAAHGCRFQAIDLRWGISEEAALDQQTMKICLTEIERCQKTSPRPNFIVLLGDRYGWRPLPGEIPADEFEQLLGELGKENKGLQGKWFSGLKKFLPKTEGGDATLLEQWYRRDNNSIPAVYCLQPRNGEFKEFSAWEIVEHRLHLLLESAALQAGFRPDQQLRYNASATEQEIVAGAMQISDANEHVFCFLRHIQGLPHDLSASNFQEMQPETAKKQEELKESLRQSLPGNIHEYSAYWQGDGPSLDHIDSLCKDVFTELSNVILSEVARLGIIDPVAREIAAHAEFGSERSRVFIGRLDVLKAIQSYIAGNDPRVMAVWGVSGSGKSALMAKAIEQVLKNQQVVVYRFIGATPESSNGRVLLASLCRQISRSYGADESTIPTEYKDLVQKFHKCLALASPGKRLILFLDALDQLSDNDHTRNLAWMPVDLPPNVRLVVSTLPGECLHVLENNLPKPNRLEIPPLTSKDGQAILDQWLEGARRKLQNHQKNEILSRFKQCGLPLYLKLAFEESRLWKSYDPLSDHELSAEIPGILNHFFLRLSEESNHGSQLVSRSLGYLASAKNGLSEDELLDVLSLDHEVLADFQRRSPKSPIVERLPAVVWARLYQDLEPYLTWRQADGTELLGFFHRQLQEGVEARYAGVDMKPSLHRRLAAYFGNPNNLFWVDVQHRQPDRRKTSELAYHLAYGGLTTDLRDLLTTFDFLDSRLVSAGTEALIGDYDLAFIPTAIQDEFPAAKENDSLRLIQGGLRLSAFALEKDPRELPSQLMGRLQAFSHPEIQRLIETTRTFKTHLWMRPLTACLPSPGGAELRTFDGTPPLAFLPDGKRVISGVEENDRVFKLWDLKTGVELRTFSGHTNTICAVAVLQDGRRAVTASNDCTLKLWDLETGAEIRTLRGHRRGQQNLNNIEDVAILPDGQHAVSAGRGDHTLKLWDLETGAELRSFVGHTEGVSAVAVSKDGRRILSGSEDRTLKLWDLETGEELRTFNGHTVDVSNVAFLPDGLRALSADSGGSLRLWNIETGAELRAFAGYAPMTVLPDGRRALSAYSARTMMLWDVETGAELRSFVGNSRLVIAVALMSNAKCALVAYRDFDQNAGTLKLWDLENDSPVESSTGHQGQIVTLAVLPDGKRAISGSEDQTLKLWNLKNGAELRTFSGHMDRIDSVAITPNGRRAISASKDLTIKEWDLESGAAVRAMLAGNSDGRGQHGVTAMAVFPDGKRIISGSYKTLRILKLITGTELQSLTGQSDWVLFIELLADGKQVVFGCYDSITLWDLETGAVRRCYTGELSWITSIAAQPDGKRVLFGLHQLEGYDLLPNGKQVSRAPTFSIKLLDLETGTELRTLMGHTDRVEGLAVLPNGKQVISACNDKSFKLWDLENGECQSTFYTDIPMSSCAAVNNSSFIAGDARGRMYFLSLEGHPSNQ